MLTLIPYSLAIVLVPILLALLFYIIYQWLFRQLQPRKSSRRLLVFLLVVVAFTLLYMNMVVYGIVGLAKWYGKQ